MFDTINAICKERGTNVRETERLAKIGEGTISHWRKSMPRVDVLARVAVVLGVSLDEIAERAKIKPATDSDGLSPVKRQAINWLTQASDEEVAKFLEFLSVVKR